MVKRRKGFSAASGDWEFFSSSPTATGTQISSRATTDVLDAFDMSLQNADPRCPATGGGK